MKLDYQNVLVTGAAGFIGYHLAKRLLENGCRVVGSS
jgi:UDP-glucuronate 4-epimerase